MIIERARRLAICSVSLSAALLMIAPASQAAGDPKAGQVKAYTCFGCHGIPGYNSVYPEYHVPKLGGQHAAYIVAALKEYQSGARQHPTMHVQASALSEQDMEDIGAYLETAPAAAE